MRRGQVGIEFMSVVLVSLVFILVFFLAIAYKQADAQLTETGRRIDALCTELATKIGNAIFFGPGFSQNITLPLAFSSTTYNVTIQDTTILCDSATYSSIKFFENAEGFNISNGVTSTPFYPPLTTLRVRNDDEIGIVISP